MQSWQSSCPLAWVICSHCSQQGPCHHTVNLGGYRCFPYFNYEEDIDSLFNPGFAMIYILDPWFLLSYLNIFTFSAKPCTSMNSSWRVGDGITEMCSLPFLKLCPSSFPQSPKMSQLWLGSSTEQFVLKYLEKLLCCEHGCSKANQVLHHARPRNWSRIQPRAFDL